MQGGAVQSDIEISGEGHTETKSTNATRLAATGMLFVQGDHVLLLVHYRLQLQLPER